VNVVDLRIQGDDNLPGLKLNELGGGCDFLDDFFLELASPFQAPQFGAESLLIMNHRRCCLDDS
jgi:hypothetical protein